jgi:NADP-dependent 3-hydroxy acid dehydrogenase YdfG
MRGLKGKWVLITQAAGGIGAATTARFIEEGARVIALGIQGKRLEKANPKLAGSVKADSQANRRKVHVRDTASYPQVRTGALLGTL